MRKKSLACLAVLSLLSVAPASFANEPGSCPPVGSASVGPPPYGYDYIANGVPSYDGCWSKNSGVVFRTDYDSCGTYRSFWDFGQSGEVSQIFVVPLSHHITGMRLFYILDFIDPHNDGYLNGARSDVYDLTTGGWLGGDYWLGWYGSLSCATRNVTLSSSVDLAGHMIQIKFSGTKGASYSDTHINVKFVSLQSP